MSNPSPMKLPKRIKQKINAESNEFAERVPKCEPHIAYYAGATEWAGRAQLVIDLLEEIGNGPFPINQKELEEWLLKTKRDARAALAKYKEVGNG